MLGSPSINPDSILGHVVSQHEILGCLLDHELSFLPLLSSLTAFASPKFDSVLIVLTHGGFPLPVIAAEVFPAGFSRFFSTGLPCAIMGACKKAHALFSLITAQIGWPMRLAMQVMEAAIVALARLRSLPQQHPAAVTLQAARVKELMAKVSAEHLGEVTDYPALRSQIVRARCCPDARREYRINHVRPFWLQYDADAYDRAASVPLNGLGLSSAHPRPTSN